MCFVRFGKCSVHFWRDVLLLYLLQPRLIWAELPVVSLLLVPGVRIRPCAGNRKRTVGPCDAMYWYVFRTAGHFIE